VFGRPFASSFAQLQRAPRKIVVQIRFESASGDSAFPDVSFGSGFRCFISEKVTVARGVAEQDVGSGLGRFCDGIDVNRVVLPLLLQLGDTLLQGVDLRLQGTAPRFLSDELPQPVIKAGQSYKDYPSDANTERPGYEIKWGIHICVGRFLCLTELLASTQLGFARHHLPNL
jgi:hypothetical protein